MHQWTVYGLTFREITVLRLVVAGKSDAEVGTTLGMNVLTANKHVSHILHKLGVTSRTQAGVKAVREGLVE
jgi:DNA-binding NarL/FixJ family response regulator